MKIGVLGSGVVGETLANGFMKHGYQVMRGSRTPEKMRDWAQKSGGAVGTFEQAAKFGELIVLAVKGEAAIEVVQWAGPANLAGKTVLDTTNPIAEAGGPPSSGVLKFFTNFEVSLMEQLQSKAPQANFVKVFSSVGSALMVNPALKGGKPSMFICGNDSAAKAKTTEILTQFGWETEDMGTAEAARAIEPLCILWCIPGFKKNDWTHAFKVLRP